MKLLHKQLTILMLLFASVFIINPLDIHAKVQTGNNYQSPVIQDNCSSIENELKEIDLLIHNNSNIDLEIDHNSDINVDVIEHFLTKLNKIHHQLNDNISILLSNIDTESSYFFNHIQDNVSRAIDKYLIYVSNIEFALHLPKSSSQKVFDSPNIYVWSGDLLNFNRINTTGNSNKGIILLNKVEIFVLESTIQDSESIEQIIRKRRVIVRNETLF